MNPSVRSRPRILLRDLFSTLANIDGFCREARELLTGLGLESEIFPVELLLEGEP